MLFVKRYVDNSFNFSVSTLTVFQSWFLKDSNVVFFSDIIRFIISTFFFLCFLFSLELEWQQISSSLYDSSKYSRWSKQCCSLDSFDSPSDFQLLQFLSQAHRDRCESSSTICITLIFMFPLQPALASMSMRTKLNICVTTKRATLPH